MIAYPEPVRRIQPPQSEYVFPEITNQMSDLVAAGADLRPGTVLEAYRHGLFPMKYGEPPELAWWSPEPRGVLELADLKISRSLRQSIKQHEIRVNTCFSEVIKACAEPRRDGHWIDRETLNAYLLLNHLGWAHSVEAWRDGRLVGGLYGVAIGGLFAGESMFHRERDASKVALAGLVELLSDQYAEERLIDVQWRTDHLASLGVSAIPRTEYLARLPDLFQLPLPDFDHFKNRERRRSANNLPPV